MKIQDMPSKIVPMVPVQPVSLHYLKSPCISLYSVQPMIIVNPHNAFSIPSAGYSVSSTHSDNDADYDIISSSVESKQSQLERYKTELCRAYMEGGKCRYVDKCQFAHGVHELRQLSRHPKYKTELCRTFHQAGFCPYGTRCNFVHDLIKREEQPPLQCSYISSSTDISNSPLVFPNSPHNLSRQQSPQLVSSTILDSPQLPKQSSESLFVKDLFSDSRHTFSSEQIISSSPIFMNRVRNSALPFSSVNLDSESTSNLQMSKTKDQLLQKRLLELNLINEQLAKAQLDNSLVQAQLINEHLSHSMIEEEQGKINMISSLLQNLQVSKKSSVQSLSRKLQF